jgi:hypothetical protein
MNNTSKFAKALKDKVWEQQRSGSILATTGFS